MNTRSNDSSQLTTSTPGQTAARYKFADLMLNHSLARTVALDPRQEPTLDKAVFESAFRSSARVQGLTHDFYKYPAGFSPQFVQLILDNLTQPGDYVLDPFMGGGTTIIEAIASGRRAIGSDLNELSYFVSTVKTTPLSQQDVAEILAWVAEVKQAAVELDSVPPLATSSVRNMPPVTFSFFAAATSLVVRLSFARRRRFARCALVSIGQWALDSRLLIPNNAAIGDHLERRVHAMFEGLGALVSAAKDHGVDKNRITAARRLLTYSAANPLLARTLQRQRIKPKLILTSPPYPGVHVLYHRWQIQGRRETPAPYWIADLRDGHGEAYYTMGSRSALGLRNYFTRLGAAFQNLRTITSPDTTIVQLVAFSNAETQLPLYLAAMQNAGFEEAHVGSIQSREIRTVPNRKWYNQGTGPTDASTEVLLVHKSTS